MSTATALPAARAHVRGRWALLATLFAIAIVAFLVPAPAHAATGWDGALAKVPDGPPEAEDVAPGNRPVSVVAVDRAGNAWFAWVQTDDTNNMATNPAIQRLRVSLRPAGGAWQPPQDVTSVTRAASSNFDQLYSPRIAVDAAGTPTVAWVVGHATSFDVRASTRSSAGAWAAPSDLGAGTIAGATGTLGLSIAMNVAPSGAAAVAWQGLDAVRLASRTAGGAWGTTETVSSAAVGGVDTVSLGRDQDGTLTVLWRDGTSDSDRTLVARTRNSEGGWGTPSTLTAAGGRVSRASLAVDATGAAVAVWGTADGVRAAVRPAGSSTWSAQTSLSTGAGNAALTAPQANATANTTAGKGIGSVAFDAHGNALVVWPEAADASASTPARVRISTVSPDGTWGPATTVADGDATYVPAWPRVVPGLDGAATVVWTRTVVGAVVSGVFTLAGGEVVTSHRDTADGAWSAPRTFATTNPPTTTAGYGSVTALGTITIGNLSVAGDDLGNTTLGWTSYFASQGGGATKLPETTDYQAAVTPRLDWTARGITGASNLRTWVNYLRANWGGPGPAGPGDVETSDGASLPDAGDRFTWRLTEQDAWRDPTTGKIVVQYQGTIRWSQPAHYIDIRFVNPRLEIAAEEKTARLISDGQTSGSMADAMAGSPSTVPFQRLRVLDVDLNGPGPRTSGDGATRTWVGAPAKLASAAASELGLTQYGLQPFGFLTVSVPATIATREDDPGPGPGPEPGLDPGADPGPGAGPGPGETPDQGQSPAPEQKPGPPPRTGKPPTVTPKKATVAKVKGSARKKGVRTVKVTLAKRLGASSKRTYRVKLTRAGKTVATGRLKGTALTLTVRKQKGKYPRLALERDYMLSSTAKPRIVKTTIRLG